MLAALDDGKLALKGANNLNLYGVGLLGSADGAQPGTMLEGENAACSMSVK